jgi:hypothetical protein
MAGACASEANGKPKATTDKRERRSLFMDAEVKNQQRIVSLLVGI